MYIAEVNSTNDYLKQHPDIPVLRTDFQTAGRGQLGNGWESERGANLLLSIRIEHVHLSAKDQWQVCTMASVALWEMVSRYMEDKDRLCIKWPNDLYYDDKKLAGMLIEHTLCGEEIASSIIGIGLNVNQTKWVGNAPNPTSIRCITGGNYPIDKLADELVERIRNIGATYANWPNLYHEHLFRKTGWWWWEERAVSTQPTMNGQRSEHSFEAEIAAVTEQGELVLRRRNGEEKTYHFKQIKYIL